MNKIYSLVEKFKTDKDYIDLTDGNFGKAEFLTKEIEVMLKHKFGEYIKQRNYKPESKGFLEAREAISNYYSELNIQIPIENILITASTSEAYNLVFQSLANIGDEILMPIPSYPLFEYIVKANHLSINTYQLDVRDEWQPDIEEIKSKITKKTKFLLIINPNNPTGSIISDSNFESICNICEEKNIYLMIDHVFEDYSESHTQYSKLIKSNKVIFINGISKLLALPDLKLGWIAMPNNKDVDIEKIETMNDMYLGANSFIQFALADLIKVSRQTHELINTRLNENRRILSHILNNQIYDFIKPIGGIHVLIGIKKELTKYKSEDELCIDLLNTEKILIHPGYFYDYTNTENFYLCFSLLHDTKVFKNALIRLNNILIRN